MHRYESRQWTEGRDRRGPETGTMGWGSRRDYDEGVEGGGDRAVGVSVRRQYNAILYKVSW